MTTSSRSRPTPPRRRPISTSARAGVDLLLADSLALREGFLKTPEGRDAEFVGPDFTDRRWFGEGAGIAVRKAGERDPRCVEPGHRNDFVRTAPTRGSTPRYFDFDVYGD